MAQKAFSSIKGMNIAQEEYNQAINTITDENF
jgi:hypothetical protein